MEVSDPSCKEAELELYTIPAQSSWFSWDDIHEIERREFEEFFSEISITRTPKVYKEYRDFIINKYREDTSRRLTFTSIRKFLVGDVNLLRKVFLFLENWGLINFGDDHLLLLSVESEGKHNAKIEQGNPAGIRVTATPNSMRPITAPPLVEERAESALKFPPLTSYSDVFTDLKKKPSHGLVCGNCGERRCDSGFYQHNKSIFNLCDKCFNNGDYGENNSADDFKLIGNSAAAAWTEEEILCLLESVLKHGDDWELIAQSVSTKTRLDCISKLIELPFGEFLMGSASGRLRSSFPTDDENLSSPSNPVEQMKIDGQEHKDTETREDNEEHHVDEDEPPAKRKRVALTSVGDNSLMKQVAAMACKVGPSITTAAAKAAIAALCDEASCPKEIFETTDDYTNPAADRADGDKDTDMEEQQEDKEDPQDLPVALRMRASVATALGAAAAHAKILADQEEREMEQLAASIIDQQLKKMQSKLKFLDHLELIMNAEEKVMEGVKETILQERISVLQCAFRSGITKRWDHTADGNKYTDMEEQQEDKEGPQDLPVALRMRASVATALGAAAAHAKTLADHEEREMEQLAASIIDQQLKKMQSKLKFLDHLELIMDAEEKVMEGVKETILQERISILQCAFRSGITKRT